MNIHILMRTVSALGLTLVATACSSPEPRVTERDHRGNYATTSEYKSTQREEFAAAIRAGLKDYDQKRLQLEERATKMGQSVVERLHKHLPGLTEQRTRLMNELVRLDAALDKDWPDRRNDTQEAYDDLRAALDEAYADVLG
jgi:hypothetical protein